MSRYIYSTVNLLPHSLSGSRWQHARVHPEAAPNSCSSAIVVWKGAAGGKPVSALRVVCSARQKTGCKGELTHTCLQLKLE